MDDLSAYLDGELSPRDRACVEAALDHDPQARAVVDRYRKQIEELHRLYDDVLDEPVPDRILKLLARRTTPSLNG